MSSQKQKALFLESKQGKLAVGERDVPKPGKGQLLVKIHAAALNPVDYKIQQTGVFVETYPTILGVDMAGVVEDVGEGVQGFAKGDKVYVQFHLGPDTPLTVAAFVVSRTGTSPTMNPPSSSTRSPPPTSLQR